MDEDRPPASGRGVTLAIILIALAAAIFAWWFQWNRGRQSLDFWGPEAAHLIRTGKQVVLFEFDRGTAPDNASEWPAAVIREIDISRAPGLVHARQALIVDKSFATNGDQPTAAAPMWEYGLRFTQDDRSVSLVINLTEGVIMRLGQPETKTLTIQKGLQVFLGEQLRDTAPKSR